MSSIDEPKLSDEPKQPDLFEEPKPPDESKEWLASIDDEHGHLGPSEKYIGAKVEREEGQVKLTQPVLLRSFIDEFGAQEKSQVMKSKEIEMLPIERHKNYELLVKLDST